MRKAAVRAVEEQRRFGAAIREGIAQADRGKLIDDEEIRIWRSSKSDQTRKAQMPTLLGISVDFVQIAYNIRQWRQSAQ